MFAEIQHFLTVPGTSVPSVGVFSTAGVIQGTPLFKKNGFSPSTHAKNNDNKLSKRVKLLSQLLGEITIFFNI